MAVSGTGTKTPKDDDVELGGDGSMVRWIIINQEEGYAPGPVPSAGFELLLDDVPQQQYCDQGLPRASIEHCDDVSVLGSLTVC